MRRWVPLVSRAPAALIIALLSVRLFDETVSYLPAGSLEQLRLDLGLSFAQAGALLALYAGMPTEILGVVADHVNRRVMSAVGAFGYGAGLLAFAAGHSFAGLVAAIVVMALSADALVYSCEVALAGIATNAELREALAAQNVLASIGDVLGPAILTAALAVGIGWRGAFVIGGALMIGYGVLLASVPILPASNVDHEDEDEREPRWRSTLRIARDPRVLLLGAGVLLISLFDEPLVGFGVAYLGETQHRSASVATLIVGASAIGGIVGALLATSRSISVQRASLGIVVGLVAFIAVPWPPAQAGAMAVVGGCAYIVWIDLQAAVLSARPGRAGTASAVVDVVSTPGVAFPLLVGATADAAGLRTALCLYVVAAVVLVAVARASHPDPNVDKKWSLWRPLLHRVRREVASPPMADEVSVKIDASADALYGLVSDVTNMGRWSPETTRAAWVGSASGPEVGAQFKGWNKRGFARWSTTCTVTKADPGREFQFEVKQSGARWGYRFEADGDGTLVTESREDARPRPVIAKAFSKLFLGPDHDAELVDGMRQTLERIKAAAEA